MILKALLLVAALGVLAWLTDWRAGRAEARAEAAYPPLGQFVEIEGHRVHAVVAGAGPDLVLIHGASGHVRDFTTSPIFEDLTRRYRVIALDRPGLGHSDDIDPAGTSLETQARVLSAAARALGAERPIVLGQSLGGAVALAWAVHHPDRLSALVSVAGVSHPWTTGLGAFYTVLSSWAGRHVVIPLITAYLPDSLIARELAVIFAPDPVPEGYAERFGVRLSLTRQRMRANALQRRGLLGWVEAQAPRYPQIAVPVEIVHGSEDRLVGLPIHSERLARDVPGARLEVLEGAGHMPHHSRPEAVIAAIDRAADRAGLR